jgi:integrase/recombinase XerD
VNQFGNPIQSQSIQSQIRKYRKDAQFEKKITPHSFRHTCATEMIRGGSSVHHVQELLGHSNIKTTEIYTKLTIVDVVKAHKSAHPRERKRLREEVCFNPLNAKIRFKKAFKK